MARVLGVCVCVCVCVGWLVGWGGSRAQSEAPLMWRIITCVVKIISKKQSRIKVNRLTVASTAAPVHASTCLFGRVFGSRGTPSMFWRA